MIISFNPKFEKILSKSKDSSLKEKLFKLITKLKENPEIGKPMKFERKGTREIYISPFKLSYIYIQKENKIVLLEIYHKDKQ